MRSDFIQRPNRSPSRQRRFPTRCARPAPGWRQRARAVAASTKGAIEAYARARRSESAGGGDEPAIRRDDRETRAAFVICLDAINFGSGWWPTIRKRPGHSGYSHGRGGPHRALPRAPVPGHPTSCRDPPSAEVAAVLDQDPEHPLMADFAAALRDVGAHVDGEHGGRFESVADAAGCSAAALADLLGWAGMPSPTSPPTRAAAAPSSSRAQPSSGPTSTAPVGQPALSYDLEPASPAPCRRRSLCRTGLPASTSSPRASPADPPTARDRHRVSSCSTAAGGGPDRGRRGCSGGSASGPRAGEQHRLAAAPLTAAEIDAALWTPPGVGSAYSGLKSCSSRAIAARPRRRATDLDLSRRAAPHWANRLTNSSAVSQTSRQPLSIVSEWPRLGID